MALIVPQTDLFSHYPCRLSHHVLRSTFPSATDAACSSSHRDGPRSSSNRRSLQCAAVTGGSKRDVEKLVARTQHRRPRHRKGMTPSKMDLIEELEEGEEAEEEVEDEINQLLTEDTMAGASEKVSEGLGEPSVGDDEPRRDLLATKNTFQGMNGTESEESNDGAEVDVTGATPRTQESRVKNVSNDAADGAKAILESTEDTVGGVVDTVADIQKQVINDAVEGGESLIEGVNDATKDASISPSSDREWRTSEDRHSTEAITDIARDTALDISNKADETGQQVRQDMAESASSIREALASQTDSAMNDFREQANEAEASVKAVADVARDTTEYLNEKASETGKQLGQDLAEVVSTGQNLFEDRSQAMSEQAKDIRSQADKFIEEERSLLEQRAARIQNETSKSVNRVQDSVQKAVQESARAARSIGVEALGIGELLVDTARETTQASFANAEKKRSYSGEGSKGEDNGSLTVPSQSQAAQQEDASKFSGFKVLVAGASGQTGRLIIEKLMSKGVSVRALVRDAYKAHSIQQLKDCECVEADLYKYETVKRAIGDCNVIICAIGARAFPLDPFSTYQVEYEGVLNLISAAKNQGKVKKFILLSTIGITYLQLVPLLFWKKQAELYLQRSGLDYTIVRSGGLRNTNEPEDVVMQGADSQFFGGISRRKVAEICVSALTSVDASDKVVEVVSVPGPQRRSIDELFKLV